jgi:hypothetical protein
LIAPIIVDIPERIRKNQRIISINLQYKLGEQIVIIPKIIIITDNHNNNQNGRACLASVSAMNINTKNKYSL